MGYRDRLATAAERVVVFKEVLYDAKDEAKLEKDILRDIDTSAGAIVILNEKR